MAAKYRISLRFKVSLLLALAVVFATSVFGYYLLSEFERDKSSFIYESNGQVARDSGKQLARFFQENQDILDFVTRNWSRDPARAGILRERMAAHEPIVSIHVFDANGELLYRTVNQTTLALVGMNLDQIQAIALKHAASTSGPEILYDKEDLFLVARSAPIGDRLVMLIQRGHVAEFTAGRAPYELELTYQKSKQSSQKRIDRLDLPQSQPEIWAAAQSQPVVEGGQRFTRSDGREFLGYFYKVNDHITLTSAIDYAKAFEDLFVILQDAAYLGAVLVVLVLIVGIVFSRSLTQPLAKLTAATEEIAAGNYLVNPKVQTRDELGVLAESFASLGQRLHDREIELEKVTELAIRDGMTGLYNHRHFKGELARLFATTKRHGQPLSLVIVDVDFFKKVNDTYGHQQGDEVIRHVAATIKQYMRDTDLAARYGGEEFAVLLINTDLKGAFVFAEKLRLGFQNSEITNIVGGAPLKKTMSLGAATFDGKNFSTLDELVERADKNLYEAKNGGRNRSVAR